MDLKSTVQLLTGRKMPVLGLGSSGLKDDTAGTIETALKMGYPMIDTSGDYGTQPGIGDGIVRAEVPRENFFIVTKVEEDEDAYESVKRNVAELGLEYADLVLIHRPPSEGAGEELWQGLIRAREEGITKDIGVSNYSADLINVLIDATDVVPVVNQIEWSPFGHSEEMLNFARANKIILQAYSPLIRGEKMDEEKIAKIAEDHKKTPAQVLIRWNLQLGVVPIIKANQEEHLKENIDVFDFELSDDDMSTLRSLNVHFSSLGVLPYV